MPCSRSARRPSVRFARSSRPASWSAIRALASNSSRPISVDLPSSTEPAVATRSISGSFRGSGCRDPRGGPLEVPDSLSIFHGRLARAVVGARLTALGHARGGDLGHDVLERGGARAHGARAGHVADRAVADPLGEGLLPVHALDEVADRVEHPVALEHIPLVGDVEARDLELLGEDVLPDVELGPVGEREHAHVLAAADAPVVEVPQLRALLARVPLAEVVAEGEHALLGAGALLVAAGAAERGVEAVLGDRVEQRRRLQPVARGAWAGLLGHAALVDRLLHAGHDRLRQAAVAELDRLREVVARVDVHDRERQRRRRERLLGQRQQHDRVLAAAEEHDGLLELGGDLPDDVDGLRLELLEVGAPPAYTAHSPSPRSTWNGTFLFQSMKVSIVSRPNSIGIARSRTRSSKAAGPTRSAKALKTSDSL